MGRAALVEEESTSGGAIVRITGVGVSAPGEAKPNADDPATPGQARQGAGAVCVLVRGSNSLVLAEAEVSVL